MGHARAVEIELTPESGAPPFVVTGGPRLVTCWPEGRTRSTVAQGRYVDLVALPGTGYVPVGPSDLVDVVRAAADVDETIEDARTRRSEPKLTLRVTPAGRDIHAEMGLLTLPKIRVLAEARSSVSVTMDNANASTSEDMTADVAAESSVAVDMEAYGEVAAVAEGESSMAVGMQAYGEVATVAAGESSVSATMDDANATTMPTPTMELDFEGPNPFNDKSGNGNHPTNNGVTVTTVAAVTGQVARFVSSENDYLTTPVTIAGTYTSFGVLVVRDSSWAGSTEMIYAATSNTLLMKHSSGDDLKAYNDSFGNHVQSVTEPPNDWAEGEAHSIAVKWDSETGAIRIYVDGAFEAETSGVPGPPGNDPIEIGRYGSQYYLNQDLSYIALWDGEALSDADIAQLHTDHIGGEQT